MMGKRRQRLRLVGLALALALVAAACGGGDDEGGGDQQQATAEKGGVLRTATTDFGFTNGFDPTGEYLGSAFTLYGALVRTLVSYKHIAGPPGNELFPDLATEIPTKDNGGISADGLSIETTESSRRRLEGRLNGGGPQIRLEGTNGGIRIASRNTQGVKLFHTGRDEHIVSAARLSDTDAEPDSEDAGNGG